MSPNTNKILVYSSIGDVSNAYLSWCKDRSATYMTAATYYGKSDFRGGQVSKVQTWMNRGRGSKFQNFARYFDQLPEADWYVVTDDDIEINPNQIRSMIATMAEKGVHVASPSHDPRGRISWDVMRPVENSECRETGFVEMTIVIFSRDAVLTFLEAYRPYVEKLVGYGMDYIIASVCPKPFLVFDSVSVLNPHNHQKRIRRREIEVLQPLPRRKQAWLEVMADSDGKFHQNHK